MLFNILLIAMFWVLVLDIADFRTTLKQILAWFLRLYLKKPVKAEHVNFEACTLCFTWWTGLVYLLFTDISLLNIVLLLCVACMTGIIKDVFYLISDFCQAIIIGLSQLIDKIAK